MHHNYSVNEVKMTNYKWSNRNCTYKVYKYSITRKCVRKKEIFILSNITTH